MTAANVKFEKLDYAPAEPGEEVRFSFTCPRSKNGGRCSGLLIAGKTGIKRDGQNRNGGAAMWDWNGDRENPSFRPSINCNGCWHGHLIKGRCVDVNGKEEPDA